MQNQQKALLPPVNDQQPRAEKKSRKSGSFLYLILLVTSPGHKQRKKLGHTLKNRLFGGWKNWLEKTP